MNAQVRGLLFCSAVAVAGLVAGCGDTTTSTPSLPTDSVATSPSSTPSTPSNWTLAQNSNGAVPGFLDGVDCVTATDCVAVGNESSTTSTRALVEDLNDGTWSTTLLPGAPGGTGDYLFSVSCPVAGSCVAVGYYFTKITGGGTGTMLVETLAGGRWTVTSTPSLTSNFRDSLLYGVSCTTPANCVAVGSTDEGPYATNLPLILTLADGAWTVTPSPGFGAAGELRAVSCTAPTTCTATGFRATPKSTKTLVESLSGGKWVVEPSPGSGGTFPAYGEGEGLSGVSCAAQSCVAVGQLMGPGPIVDTLTNQGWSASSNPNPNSADSATGLLGVSCPAPATCVAVGAVAKAFNSNAGTGELGSPLGALIETKSSGQWAIASNPSGLPADSGLDAVSCVGQACVAVGQSGQASASDTTRTLIIQTKLGSETVEG